MSDFGLTFQRFVGFRQAIVVINRMAWVHQVSAREYMIGAEEGVEHLLLVDSLVEWESVRYAGIAPTHTATYSETIVVDLEFELWARVHWVASNRVHLNMPNGDYSKADLLMIKRELVA